MYVNKLNNGKKSYLETIFSKKYVHHQDDMSVIMFKKRSRKRQNSITSIQWTRKGQNICVFLGNRSFSKRTILSMTDMLQVQNNFFSKENSI